MLNRTAHWRIVLKGTVSHRAMVTRLAGGVDPRGVMWRRKITPSAEPVTTKEPVHAA